METITSRTNPTVRLVRLLLARRAARYRERAFVAEGVRTITTLVERGLKPRALLLDAARLVELPEGLTAAVEAEGGRVLSIASPLFRELSDVEEPQPALAVFEMPDLPLPDQPEALLALDGIQDPGNLGSILRSAAASGIDGVLLLPGTVDRFGPKVVRATAGLIGSLPVLTAGEAMSYVHQWHADGGRVILADGAAPTAYTECDWTQPFILVLGSEASGASAAVRQLATEAVKIPMERDVESINVAAAAAVLLFEARRQRIHG